MKVRAFCDGQDRHTISAEEQNQSHEREDDMDSGCRPSSEGKTQTSPSIGSLLVARSSCVPAYISGPQPSLVSPGTILLLLETGGHTTASGDVAIKVLTDDGRIGWTWSSAVGPADD